MKTRSNKPSPQITIGKIWAKWCGHCLNLIPVWDKMKQLVNQNAKSLPTYMEVEEADIKQIDDFNESNPNGTFIDKARGYPTIYKIVGGKIEYYTGEREAKKMAEWALNKKIMKGGKTRKLKRKTKRVKVKHT